jgi:hypothetical protein
MIDVLIGYSLVIVAIVGWCMLLISLWRPK